MTPLQSFLVAVAERSSYNEMARLAHDRGLRITASRIQQIARDPEPTRLTENAVRALAAATGVDPRAIATLETEGLFDNSRYKAEKTARTARKKPA